MIGYPQNKRMDYGDASHIKEQEVMITDGFKSAERILREDCDRLAAVGVKGLASTPGCLTIQGLICLKLHEKI